MNRIFNSANLSEKLRLLQVIVDKLGAKFNLETGEPKEGVLLGKDDAAVWKAFTELKLKPEDIKKMSEEYGKLKAKDNERIQEEEFADAAEALDYENVPALTRWLLREKLVLEFKDQRIEVEQEDGTKKKVLKRMPYVRPANDDKATLSPLEEYIENEVPEFVDIFKTLPEGDDEDGKDESGDDGDIVIRAATDAQERVRKQRGGVRVPATRSARMDNGSNKDKRTIEQLEKEARGNSMYRI
jgi:actin-related protein